MKLYVINLDRSPDRLDRLEKIFGNLNLGFTRVAAIDGLHLDEKFIADVRRHQLWPDPLTRGEIACFLSHRAVLEKVAAGDDDFAAIFEDDVILSGDAGDFLNNDHWIPAGADIVKIETHYKKVWLGKSQTLKQGYQIAPLKSRHIMAAGYIVSRQAATRLCTMMGKITFPFDHFLFNPKCHVFEQFEMWQLDPAIVRQAGLISTLSDDRIKIDRENKSKRVASKTLRREIKRFFSRAKIGLWGIYVNYLTHGHWKRVKYKP